MIGRRMIFVIWSGYLIIAARTAVGQPGNELIRQWSQIKHHDTAYVNLSNKIAEQLNHSGAFDSAFIFSDSALFVSSRLHYPAGTARAKFIEGELNIAKSNFASGIDYILEARSLFDSLSDPVGIADCILQTGIIYYFQKSYLPAISYFKQADSAYAKLHQVKHSSTARYLEGRCELELSNYAKAEQLLKEAEQSKQDLVDEKGWYECHWALADLYLRTGGFEKSKQYYEQCLKYFLAEENKQGIAMMHYGIGEVYLSLDKTDSAEKYFLLALAESNRLNFLEVIVKSARELTSLYSHKGDFEKALTYQSQYYAGRDSLHSEQTAVKIANIQAESKISKAKSEIALLTQKQENNQILFYALISIIILLVGLGLMSLQRYYFKQKTNKILQQTNDDLQTALQNLKDTQNKLVQSEKLASLGQLTAGVAHEINNPINFVSGNVNPLKRNFSEVKKLIGLYEHLLSQTNQKQAAEECRKELNLDENFSESDHLLEGIEEGSRRTALIVKGLRNFSRLDSEEMKLVSINEGIETTLPLIRNKLSEKNIEVIKSLGNIPQIEGYPGQLNQVFMNLLTNAIDASYTNGKIFITTWKEKNFVAISIRDTGTGMTDEVKEKMFDPFFTTKEVGKGTGLGLSISYGIVEKHNGKIEVKSESGKGSEFIVWLPG